MASSYSSPSETSRTTRPRAIDIVLFGATSFVGRIVAEYLATTYPAGVHIALAGRNESALEKLRCALGCDFPLLVADAADERSIDVMCARASVVISTVGPYSRYGESVVKACTMHGTDYVDLCGEVFFIRDCIDRYHEQALRTGARIVHSCGFDSVPSDMGMFALSLAAGEEFRRVYMIVEKLKGGLSGGTIDSMREVSRLAHESKEKARLLHHPYALCPDPSAEVRVEGLGNDILLEELQIGPVHSFVGPFFMGPFNTRVVRRSNSLLGHRYGRSVAYKEAWATGLGLRGRLRAQALLAASGIGFAAIQQQKLRKLLSVVVPEPGEGPSENSRRKGYFQVTHVGETLSGRVVSTRISATGDPGYEVTAMMLAEAALTLLASRRNAATAKERAATGGVLTPATALGEPYLARLRAHGMVIS